MKDGHNHTQVGSSLVVGSKAQQKQPNQILSCVCCLSDVSVYV